MRKRFTGKTVIVTGGVSGIGESISMSFAREGANVILDCMPGEAAGPIVLEKILAEGGQAILVEADISKEDDVKMMINKGIEHYGKIDIFVANAAAFDGYKPLLETTEENWDRVVKVNLKGAYFCSKNIITHMLENGGGALIFISSIAGLIAGHGGAAYTTTKHGIIGLSKQITFDYGSKGIRCNSICPGSIYTPLSASALDSQAAIDKLSKTPFGKHGQPKHISDTVLFLASDEAEFIHGTSLLVDGGNVVRKW